MSTVRRTANRSNSHAATRTTRLEMREDAAAEGFLLAEDGLVYICVYSIRCMNLFVSMRRS